EISCVSETLAPAMLQFLQCKVFGSHSLPERWISTAAGNPPEYNKSVKEFDIATLDRVKRINVTEDLTVWKEYAAEIHIHPAILAYLGIKKENFYALKSELHEKTFVTARGWEDLSRILTVYEELGILATQQLISQYLQHPDISRDFSNYLDLFYTYQGIYPIEEILNGQTFSGREETILRLQASPIDERISFLQLLAHSLELDALELEKAQSLLQRLEDNLMQLHRKASLKTEENSPVTMNELLSDAIRHQKHILSVKSSNHLLSPGEEDELEELVCWLEQSLQKEKAAGVQTAAEGLPALKNSLSLRASHIQELQNQLSLHLEHTLDFLCEIFSENSELYLFLSELSLDASVIHFISRSSQMPGARKYLTCSQQLMGTVLPSP
ncbi:MAG: ATPase, partial [Lachnospiraceae bacterium]|nr:ATPase [Lachnospiraceae bacterium]